MYLQSLEWVLPSRFPDNMRYCASSVAWMKREGWEVDHWVGHSCICPDDPDYALQDHHSSDEESKESSNSTNKDDVATARAAKCPC